MADVVTPAAVPLLSPREQQQLLDKVRAQAAEIETLRAKVHDLRACTDCSAVRDLVQRIAAEQT